MRKVWRYVHARVPRIELIVLLAVLAMVTGGWGFIKLTQLVLRESTQQMDERIVRSLRQPDDPASPIGPRWLHEVSRDITAVGGVAVLSIITLLVIGFLLLRRQLHGMWLVLIATGGGLLLSTLLKNIVDRDRPVIVPHLAHVYTQSFPSGHSMLSAVVYLTLGALMARFVAERRIKFFLIFAAILLTFLVGISRVFMGVHYPTDVLAGWSAGLVWAMLCWLVARYLQQRGAVEKANEQTDHGKTHPARPEVEG